MNIELLNTIFITFKHVNINIYIYIYIYIYIIYIHKYIHLYLYIYIHIYVCSECRVILNEYRILSNYRGTEQI